MAEQSVALPSPPSPATSTAPPRDDTSGLLSPSPHAPPLPPSAASTPSSALTADDMRGMVVFCAPKAGMASVDTAKVNSVVYQMSKDSLHFRHQQQLSARNSSRIAQLQRRIATLRSEPPSYLAHLNVRAVELLQSLECQRDLSRVWLHLDLDSFYASVELRDRPHLRDKPVAIGSMSMICTSNYHARQFGVRSAMPGFIAVKLCPQLQFIPTDFPKYKAAAAIFRGIFAQYDPHFESASLDEAYLDITSHLAAKQARQPPDQPWERDAEAAAVAAEIRQRVYDATQLTCSAGIACNRMLAKIATDVRKPNGQHLVPFNLPAVLDFISPLPVRQVPGIGKVLERTLNAIGVQCVGQLRDDEYRALVVDCFSELTYGWLFRVSLGIGRSEHENDDERRRKSVSTERTFRDISSYAELAAKADDIARSLHGDIERLQVKGRTLTLKLKTAAFEVKQHSVSVDRGLWIHELEDVRRLALQLLKAELNLLLAGRKVKRAAEDKAGDRANSATAGVVAQLAVGGKVAAGSPFDNLMRIRLMGLRLSALHIDESGEADDDTAGDGGGGGERVAGGGAKRRSDGSILRFTRRVEADPDAVVDEERSEQGGSKRRKVELDNVDISQYFNVASPSKARTQQPSAEERVLAGVQRSRSIRRSIESYFSQSVAADGAACADDADEVLEEDGVADEWMELLQDAAEASPASRLVDGQPQSPLAPLSDATTCNAPSPDCHSPSAPSPPTPSADVATHHPPSASVATVTPPTSAPAPVAPASCPVCGAVLQDGEGRPVSNLALNKHIDACLARDADSLPPPHHTAAARKTQGRPGRGRGGQVKREDGAARAGSLVDMWKRKTA